MSRAKHNCKGVNTKCPFYKFEDKYSITCEGFAGDNSLTAKFTFKTAADKNLQKAEWCDKNFCYCEYYRCIMQAKYSED